MFFANWSATLVAYQVLNVVGCAQVVNVAVYNLVGPPSSLFHYWFGSLSQNERGVNGTPKSWVINLAQFFQVNTRQQRKRRIEKESFWKLFVPCFLLAVASSIKNYIGVTKLLIHSFPFTSLKLQFQFVNKSQWTSVFLSSVVVLLLILRRVIN